MTRIEDELHRWLDGELHERELPDELRKEAERWKALLAARAEPRPAPPWLERRVMAGLPAHGRGRAARLLEWITRPRTLRFRPITVAAGAMVVLALVLLSPGGPVPEPQADARAGARLADGGVYVQFLYVAPEAGAVAVAGDFNGWSADQLPLEDPDGDGIWTGEAPLSPGLHKYMFVVDGEWVTDPQADRYIDDGFGNRNALIEVPVTGDAI